MKNEHTKSFLCVIHDICILFITGFTLNRTQIDRYISKMKYGSIFALLVFCICLCFFAKSFMGLCISMQFQPSIFSLIRSLFYLVSVASNWIINKLIDVNIEMICCVKSTVKQNFKHKRCHLGLLFFLFTLQLSNANLDPSIISVETWWSQSKPSRNSIKQ